MAVPKTNTENQRALRERRRRAGWVERIFWIHPDDVAKVRAYIAKLVKARGGLPEKDES